RRGDHGGRHPGFPGAAAPRRCGRLPHQTAGRGRVPGNAREVPRSQGPMISEPLAHCSILIVDDEEANLDLLEGLLLSEGYRRITRVSDARTVLDRWKSCHPDLVLLDLHMPHRSGFEILADLRRLTARDDFRPVLVLTAD